MAAGFTSFLGPAIPADILNMVGNIIDNDPLDPVKDFNRHKFYIASQKVDTLPIFQPHLISHKMAAGKYVETIALAALPAPLARPLIPSTLPIKPRGGMILDHVMTQDGIVFVATDMSTQVYDKSSGRLLKEYHHVFTRGLSLEPTTETKLMGYHDVGGQLMETTLDFADVNATTHAADDHPRTFYKKCAYSIHLFAKVVFSVFKEIFQDCLSEGKPILATIGITYLVSIVLFVSITALPIITAIGMCIMWCTLGMLIGVGLDIVIITIFGVVESAKEIHSIGVFAST